MVISYLIYILRYYLQFMQANKAKTLIYRSQRETSVNDERCTWTRKTHPRDAEINYILVRSWTQLYFNVNSWYFKSIFWLFAFECYLIIVILELKTSTTKLANLLSTLNEKQGNTDALCTTNNTKIGMHEVQIEKLKEDLETLKEKWLIKWKVLTLNIACYSPNFFIYQYLWM